MSISVFGSQQQSADPFASLATYQPESAGSFAPYVAGDGVAASPASGAFGSQASPLASALGGGALGGSSSPLASIFGTMLQSIMTQLQSVISLFSQLAGGASSGSQAGSASPAGYAPAGSTPAGSSGMPEQYVADATANSVGDPHESFQGTMADGSQLGSTWNSMRSHGNLLSSDSFAGGYRVSTTVTDPNAKGVTLNRSANVATNGGATNVALRGDGSYSVTQNGQALSLQTGQATSLGNGESVTLNADKSLTVSDTNGSGGTMSTTLSTNGAGGVDVRNTAHDVDLGGYLMRHAEGAQAGSSSGAGTVGFPTGSGPVGFPIWQQQQQLADPVDPLAVQLA